MQRFVYDTGAWQPSLSYFAAPLVQAGQSEFLGKCQSMAWGPDLSGSQHGAGGIVGLAILTDDGWEASPSSALGPMLPTYDHNGNVTRIIRAENSTVVAAYEYGPFGESRTLRGVYSQRNPFR